MFCSACGTAIPPGQTICPQCGRALAPAVPPVPGVEFELQQYRSNVKVLAVVWFVWAGLSLLMGIAGLHVAHSFLMGGGFGIWRNAPWASGIDGRVPPAWLPMAMHFAMVFILLRTALAALTGWGLIEGAQWGRVLAIIVAILSLLRFPLGTALGIWTLVMLLGYRHSTLYARL